MSTSYLHERKDFPDLLRLLEQETGILPYLLEKDYWIMHVLQGLKKMGLEFELKGGTLLSKGYQIIHRFSEDIDIHIHPPKELNVDTNPKKIKSSQVKSRKDYEISISENDAFLLSSVEQRQRFKERYVETKALYYKEQPDFDDILERIGKYIDRL